MQRPMPRLARQRARQHPRPSRRSALRLPSTLRSRPARAAPSPRQRRHPRLPGTCAEPVGCTASRCAPRLWLGQRSLACRPCALSCGSCTRSWRARTSLRPCSPRSRQSPRQCWHRSPDTLKWLAAALALWCRSPRSRCPASARRSRLGPPRDSTPTCALAWLCSPPRHRCRVSPVRPMPAWQLRRFESCCWLLRARGAVAAVRRHRWRLPRLLSCWLSTLGRPAGSTLETRALAGAQRLRATREARWPRPRRLQQRLQKPQPPQPGAPTLPRAMQRK
mmetsp:Transcript_3405/g.14032  ORF Transcript_3405/g.14032 Transcript_3405/m.14032 type:complete len:278 (-) Transcript_3405:3340-4173(-)